MRSLWAIVVDFRPNAILVRYSGAVYEDQDVRISILARVRPETGYVGVD
jgi:hypothetical protein